MKLPATSETERQESLKWLALTIILTIVVWNSPFAVVLYPFTLLATWFHEMGHGIAGMLMGGRFEELLIYRDGSGLAVGSRSADLSRFGSAFISAGGPLGPALAGGALIVASRWRRGSAVALGLLAATLLLSTLLVVRSLTGWIVLPALALAIIAAVRFATLRQRQLLLQVLGLQACISTYTSLGYLFSRGGVVGGRLQASDTEQMARALLLPYWVWGGLLTIAIAAIILASLRYAYRR